MALSAVTTPPLPRCSMSSPAASRSYSIGPRLLAMRRRWSVNMRLPSERRWAARSSWREDSAIMRGLLAAVHASTTIRRVSNSGHVRRSRLRIRGSAAILARTADGIPMPDEQTKQEYLSAYEAWLRHLAEVHAVLLEGRRLDPPRLKGLLNREARAKLRYDA